MIEAYTNSRQLFLVKLYNMLIFKDINLNMFFNRIVIKSLKSYDFTKDSLSIQC